MKTIIGFVLIFISAIVLAEGWVPIIGKNNLGEKIIVNGSCDEELVDCNADMTNKYHITIVKNGKDIKTFKRQFCEQDSHSYSKKIVGKFHCLSSGVSPLARAEYNIYNDHSECGGYNYICIKGCSINAPKKMHQNPWEC